MERHGTDTVSLVFGVLFVAIALVGISDVVELSAADVRWVAPGLLVLLGVLLVLPIGRGKASKEVVASPAAQPGASDDESPDRTARLDDDAE